MKIEFQLELWHLFCIVATLLGAYWALIVLIVKQFNNGLTARFATLEEARSREIAHAGERFDRMEENQKKLDRDLLMLKAELPDKYVKREDAIRSEMTLHAKFDGLAARIDTFLRVRVKNNE
jgi:hypothetical protein